MKPILTLSVFYAAFMASPAFAYIDPVTGSFILQAIIGGFAAAAVAIRRVRERILGLLGLRKSDADADGSNAAEGSDNS